MAYVATDSDAYEQSMGRWSRALAEPFLDALPLAFPLAPGARVLDAGCGTGALSAALAARDPAARLTGLDYGQAYLLGARRRVPGAAFARGDIGALPFASGAFDSSLALLVLGFVPDAAQAVAEMARVTRPGGVVATAMWDFRGGMPFLNLFADTVAALLPQGAAWRARHWRGQVGAPGRLSALLRGAGLEAVREQDIAIRQDFRDFDDWFGPWLAGQGIMGAFLMALSPADRARVEAALREAWGDPAAGCSFTATARLAWGRHRGGGDRGVTHTPAATFGKKPLCAEA